MCKVHPNKSHYSIQFTIWNFKSIFFPYKWIKKEKKTNSEVLRLAFKHFQRTMWHFRKKKRVFYEVLFLNFSFCIASLQSSVYYKKKFGTHVTIKILQSVTLVKYIPLFLNTFINECLLNVNMFRYFFTNFSCFLDIVKYCNLGAITFFFLLSIFF